MEGAVAEMVIKWGGKEYPITGIPTTDTILDLKSLIHKQTGVLPERQKLLGLKSSNGKPPSDDMKISELSLKPKTKIMMIGTLEEVLADIIEPPPVETEVVNDFDIEDEEIAIQNREEYLAKIEKRVKSYDFKILNEPRPGTKLLVLDVDYTLFDHRSSAECGLELMRPYLHEFLTSAYADYDIVIWSATNMKWIDVKMQELGVAGHKDYKLCMMLDDLAMITVDTPKYGVIEVKPLGVIWGRFTQWNQGNTIMVDDLRRNFIMNPQNGLKIRPFKNAHTSRDTDRELLHLKDYLKNIAQLGDFSVLNHKRWERYSAKKYNGKRRRHHHDEDRHPDTAPS